MGWRFRFGPVNLSKNGTSVGLPGYRFTFGPKGTRHTTYIPGLRTNTMSAYS